MLLKVKGGGEFNRPVKVVSVHVASAVINRIAPQGSYRYSRRGHNTIVLHRLCWRVYLCLFMHACLFMFVYARVSMFFSGVSIYVCLCRRVYLH